jgi:hypothetical protein
MGNRFLDIQLSSSKDQKQLLHALNQSYVRKWNEEQQELTDKMRVLYSSISHSAAPDRYVS